MTSDTITAIVLAGGDAQEPLAQHFAVAAKSLIPLAGKPLAYYTLKALAQTPAITEVIYVGTEHPELFSLYHKQRAAGENLLASLESGITAISQSTTILLISADLPWLTAADLGAFIATETDAQLCYPVIPKAAVEQQFPRQHRDYVPLLEAKVTGGSMMLLDFPVLERLLPYAQKTYAARKNLMAMAKLLGFQITMRLLIRRLGIYHIERHISRTLGIRARAIMLDHAALAIDVDDLTQLREAELFFSS